MGFQPLPSLEVLVLLSQELLLPLLLESLTIVFEVAPTAELVGKLAAEINFDFSTSTVAVSHQAASSPPCIHLLLHPLILVQHNVSLGQLTSSSFISMWQHAMRVNLPYSSVGQLTLTQLRWHNHRYSVPYSYSASPSTGRPTLTSSKRHHNFLPRNCHRQTTQHYCRSHLNLKMSLSSYPFYSCR